MSKGIALCPEGRRVFTGMSVQDNLDMGAFTRDDAEAAETIEKVFDSFPRLKERRNQSAGTLSGGEQQMLAMGRALMSKPKLLMLDEPSMGLAPILVQEIFEIIKRLHSQGTTILLVEQNAARAARGRPREEGLPRRLTPERASRTHTPLQRPAPREPAFLLLGRCLGPALRVGGHVATPSSACVNVAQRVARQAGARQVF